MRRPQREREREREERGFVCRSATKRKQIIRLPNGVEYTIFTRAPEESWHISKSILEQGIWEPEITEQMIAVIKIFHTPKTTVEGTPPPRQKRRIFLDVGANIG